jgi:multimeric flavodoxin WrbA
MPLKATVINCTLKSAPETSNTEALANVVAGGLRDREVDVELIRALDYEIKPGVETDLGDGDEWPQIHEKLVDSEILVIATPTWLGRPSSVAQRVLERMDAMLSETDDDDRPVAYDRVAGVVVTGNEDGAHHVISEITGALMDIGYTIPGQAWTYWNKGPGPGDEYLEADDPDGKEWSRTTGLAAAQNLVSVAEALAAKPMEAPPEG